MHQKRQFQLSFGYPLYSNMALFVIFTICQLSLKAQSEILGDGAIGKYELNSGWVCKKASDLVKQGKKDTNWKKSDFPLKGWMKATVPGTVLTTLLNNKLVPDPFYGMNNERIADIYDVGKAYYTYWFVRDFNIEPAKKEQQLWLHFRGVNYGFDVYLNGVKLNKEVQKGMFMRRVFNITKAISENGHNRLAVIVYPPDEVGEANGGQGGDGTIAKNVAHQYVAGWDWIQPIRDRNTGIWDKVWLEKSGAVQVKDPQVITTVPGKRLPEAIQKEPASIHAFVSLRNSSDHPVKGAATFEINGQKIKKEITLAAGSTEKIAFPAYALAHPRLWWPTGMGPDSSAERYLYPAHFEFKEENGAVSDSENLKVGVRQISTHWNTHTRSMEVLVNGQRIFIKGGNWIVSDAMLRLSTQRYDAEVRFHRDMRLNLIRVWGGALTERPEFYDACDKYGLLVMQDFWGSGDCNGRWEDPKKKDDIWTRRGYPDDHALFLASAADQIKMLRSHASLAIWCGGNEITLPPDLQRGIQDSLLPLLDTTRWYIDYSNSDSMSFNTLGGNGDGPYGIQPLERFWSHRTYPFNSEIGSVGIGDATSLERFLPAKNQVVPPDEDASESLLDSVWQYHKYIGYGPSIKRYGHPKNMAEFAKIAQLVNYNQYRGLMEGFTGHQWDWYTGVIIWKTQNPWTAMRGQMYDYYLDPNAGLFGLRKAGEQMHVMYNPADSGIYLLNNSYLTRRNMVLEIKACSMEGKVTLLTRTVTQAVPGEPKYLLSMSQAIKKLSAEKGVLLSLQLLDLQKKVISDNVYLLADKQGNYSGLATMPAARLKITAHWSKKAGEQRTDNATEKKTDQRRIVVELSNPKDAPPAFFNRLSAISQKTGKRLLPTFYSDNYVTLLPGSSQTIYIDPPAWDNSNKEIGNKEDIGVSIEGWNLPRRTINLN